MTNLKITIRIAAVAAFVILASAACQIPIAASGYPYPDIAAALLDSALLDVYLTNDGKYVIDLFDWDGTRLFPAVPGTTVPADTAGLLYENPGTVTRLDVLDDGTVRYILEDGAGIIEYAVSRNGLTILFDTSGGSEDINLYFMDLKTGISAHRAYLQIIDASHYTLHFQDLITPDVSFLYSTDMLETIRLIQSIAPFSNDAVQNGELVFEMTLDTDQTLHGHIMNLCFTHD